MKNYKFALLVIVAIVAFAVAGNSLVYAQLPYNLSNFTPAPAPNFQPQQVSTATQAAGLMPPFPELQPGAKPNGMLVILIGINDYTENSIRDLSGAEDTRMALTDWLVPYSKTKNRVTVWVASDRMNDLAQKHNNIVTKCMLPTKANILQLLKDAKNVNYNRLIVFFCGHGARIQNKSYLIPQDGTVDNVSSFISLKDEVFVYLDNSTVENKLLVLDACRNNIGQDSENSASSRSVNANKSATSDDFMSEFETMLKDSTKTFTVITSCSKGEQAQELPHNKTNNGLFMWHFIKGLAGEADMVANYDGKIKLVEAYNYARSKTYKQTVNSEFLDVQTPELFCNYADSFIISSAGNWVNESEHETPWHLLYRTAVALAKQDDPKQQQNTYYGSLYSNFSFPSNKATRILTGLLEINPSEQSCYSLRSGIYRKKGMYKEALLDIRKTNGTLDVYSKLNQSTYDKKTYQPINYCTLYSSSDGKEIAGYFNKVLPISLDTYKDGYYKVVAIDGIQTTTEYWISEESITWNSKTAETTITGYLGNTYETLQSTQRRLGVPASNHGGGVVPWGGISVPQ